MVYVSHATVHGYNIWVHGYSVCMHVCMYILYLTATSLSTYVHYNTLLAFYGIMTVMFVLATQPAHGISSYMRF